MAAVASLEQSEGRALRTLRQGHRTEQQALQQEESSVAARLASFDSDLAAKEAERKAAQGLCCRALLVMCRA